MDNIEDIYCGGYKNCKGKVYDGTDERCIECCGYGETEETPSTEPSKDDLMKRTIEIRNELFGIANSFAGDETGFIAVCIHGACNEIASAMNSYDLYKKIEGR